MSVSNVAACHAQRGYTLFETILVIGLLASVSVALIKIQPRFFATQTAARDLAVGHALMQDCAERVLAARRNLGYASVDNALCAGVAASAGFGVPSLKLYDNAGTLLGNGVACSASVSPATCRAVVGIAKTSGPAALLPDLTLRMSSY